MRRFFSLSLCLGLLCSSTALAYPWMLKHGYQSCAACHVDPSGSGQLSAYGRAQSDTLLRWKLTPPPPGQEEDVPKSANFLWFAELPEWLNLSGNLRNGALIPVGGTVRPLLMANELYLTLKYDRFVGHVTTGVGFRNAGLAAIAPVCAAAPCGTQWVSREHWLGVNFNDETVMVRAGRLNLPFGLRNNEHTSWVRALTLTDTNTGQSLGVSASYNAGELRGEVMGFAGNFSLAPDAYRERGYSAFAEYALRSNFTLGVSSLVAASRADFLKQLPQVRHAHGLFARLVPATPLTFTAEGDVLIWQQPGLLDRIGFASFLQTDVELIQGVHLAAMLEAMHQGDGARGPSIGLWGTANWYVLPHVEIRVDGIYRRLASQSGLAATGSFTVLAQLHVFL